MEFIASRELAKACNVKNKKIVSSCGNIDNNLIDQLTEDSSIYVCNTAINNFAKNLHKLKCNIVLVSGDSDDTISLTPETEKILNCDKIKHWFAQNCVIYHSKISRMPIGLDYHTIACGAMPHWGAKKTEAEQEAEIKTLLIDVKPFYERKIACYANFHFAKTRGDRMNAINALPSNLVHYEPTNVSRLETFHHQMDYAFVISPFGCGLDCHRTWEALILGCIPIIAHSGLDPLFDDLPVLLIDKWSDVSEDLLDRTILEFQNRNFNFDKLKLNYWVERFNIPCH